MSTTIAATGQNGGVHISNGYERKRGVIEIC